MPGGEDAVRDPACPRVPTLRCETLNNTWAASSVALVFDGNDELQLGRRAFGSGTSIKPGTQGQLWLSSKHLAFRRAAGGISVRFIGRGKAGVSLQSQGATRQLQLTGESQEWHELRDGDKLVFGQPGAEGEDLQYCMCNGGASDDEHHSRDDDGGLTESQEAAALLGVGQTTAREMLEEDARASALISSKKRPRVTPDVQSKAAASIPVKQPVSMQVEQPVSMQVKQPVSSKLSRADSKDVAAMLGVDRATARELIDEDATAAVTDVPAARGIPRGREESSTQPVSRTLAMMIDFSMPAQSLRGIGKAEVEDQVRNIDGNNSIRLRLSGVMTPVLSGVMKRADDWLSGMGLGPVMGRPVMGALQQLCFHSMVQREQEHFQDYVVFYHSYSSAALLYEVQAEIARIIYGLEDDFAPLTRLLKGPYNEKPELSMLMEDFSKMHGQDHDPRFRALAISTSLSLFGGDTEAPPLALFERGYCAGRDMSFRGILTGVLDELGIENAAHVIAQLIEVGRKYQLSVAPYEGNQAFQRQRLAKGFGKGKGKGKPPAEHMAGHGHMLQVFIHKHWVDDLSYPCAPFGKRDGLLSTTAYVEKGRQVSGQARVFCHPDVFLDSTRSRVFHYCANPELCSMLTGSDLLTRGNLTLDLRTILQPLVLRSGHRVRSGIDGEFYKPPKKIKRHGGFGYGHVHVHAPAAPTSYHDLLRSGVSHVDAMAAMARADAAAEPPKKRKGQGRVGHVPTAVAPTSYHDLLRAGVSHDEAIARADAAGV